MADIQQVVKVVEFEYSLFDVTMTTEEVKEMYGDVQFLQNALLTILADQQGIKIDTPFEVPVYKEYLKEYFEGTSTNMDLVRKLLNQE